jgi:hypothetical protein
MDDDERFSLARAAFAALSAADPELWQVDGVARPRELVQSERLARWVERLEPEASLPLRLAAQCQHVERFRVPRASYADGRSGYLRWRADLAARHASTAEHVLREVGYDETTVERVRQIVLKRNLRENSEVQAMEDALCLSFLEHELTAFAERHPDPVLLRILRKTWGKMSARAQTLALGLPLGVRVVDLISRAIGEAKGQSGEL